MAPDNAQKYEAALAEWFNAFNARDLDRLIAGSAPDIRLYPLPLAGLKKSYLGHDGLGEWFEDISDAGHEHKIVLSRFRSLRPNEIVGIGEMEFSEDGHAFPFWARDLFEDGLLSIARHYLTEPEVGAFLRPL